MVNRGLMAQQKQRYLELLSEKYPTKESVYSRLINLQARLVMPKGVEHFVSDLHGEYELFYHILNNCSGVIKEKVDYVFGEHMTKEEKAEFCTLVYYPREKIDQIRAERKDTPHWYEEQLTRMLEVCKMMSYKFPMRKVRDFIPDNYKDVLVELLSTHPEADKAQFRFNKSLINMIVQVEGAADFIVIMTQLIKRMAVDHLHIVGDFFDRGSRPDAIMDRVMEFHSLDIQWGNHDCLWMGAACGSEVCIAGVVRNSLHYKNTDVLERGYGISIRPLFTMASRIYSDKNPLKAAEIAISMIMFKLEGQLIQRNPDFHMTHRMLLNFIDFDNSTIELNGKKYDISHGEYFKTINPQNPYELSTEENEVIEELKSFFLESEKLQNHVDFLYRKGGMYTCFNGNLLFHGCVPMDEEGIFKLVNFGGKIYKGREYFDFCDQMARRAYHEKRQDALDFMWFLWCGLLAPTAGREFHTFEAMFIDDTSTHKEPNDPYFQLIDDVDVCEDVLREFGLDPKEGHIINGHVPVKVKKGETPLRGGGKALVIDGGFCRAYHQKTGISGYTLISNSRSMRLLAHNNVADVRIALKENKDIESVSETIEIQSKTTEMKDTDKGHIMQAEINDLYNLLNAYRNGTVKPRQYIH